MAYLSDTTGAIVSEACIDQMVQKIVDHVQPLQVILFGSYATGTPVTASDLDLFVIASRICRAINDPQNPSVVFTGTLSVGYSGLYTAGSRKLFRRGQPHCDTGDENGKSIV